MTPTAAPRFYAPKQVRALTSLSEPTLWRLRRAGRFPLAIQLSNRRIGYPADAVDAWIASRTRA